MTARRPSAPEPLWQLDLHGSNPERAIQRVQNELATRYPRGHSPGLIITGRGNHSVVGKSPVLVAVKRFLHSPQARALGVKNVQPDRGGGAFLVDLYAPGEAPK